MARRPLPPGAPIGAGGRGLAPDASTRASTSATLREIYLPQFEAAVKEGGAGSVMCSYPRVNGQYACENQHLLEDVLKRDWGFPGFVLTDYGAAKNTVERRSTTASTSTSGRPSPTSRRSSTRRWPPGR